MRWGFVILWMILIFCFSHQPNSNEITKEVFGDAANYWVRKGAHVTEYLVLFLLSYWALPAGTSRLKRRMQASIIAIIYACTDEIHQGLVPGRSAAVADVLIDATGVVVGCVLLILNQRWRHEKGSQHSHDID